MIPRTLFVCTNNAGRSQMAQAMFTCLAKGEVEVKSAGVDPWSDIHPMARKLMAERGETMVGYAPEHVDVYRETAFDWVVTIGDVALAQCGDVAGNPRRIHWDLGDPAVGDGTDQSEAIFRNTLARIEERLPDLLKNILNCQSARDL